MKPFSGFPASMQFTPVPNPFFSRLLSEISDIAELKTLLYVFWSIYGKRGYPRFTTYHELASNPALLNGLADGESSPEALRSALEKAEKRGAILHLSLDRDGITEEVYFVNTERDRHTVEKIRNGELTLPGLKSTGQTCPAPVPEMPDIFTVYEENIGLLTPMIADELRDAARVYPEVWIRDALKKAVAENKRKWSYIQAILERWVTEGKKDGTYQGDFEASSAKYHTQKYDHLVQR